MNHIPNGPVAPEVSAERRASLRAVSNEKLGRRIVRGQDRILAAAVTDCGSKGNNQDGFVVGEGIGAMIDAMGGGAHGGDAARVIVEAIREDFSMPEEMPLMRAARRAAQAMEAKAKEFGFDKDRDGAVVAMARDQGDHIEGLTIGDPALFIIDLTDRKIVERGRGQSTADEFMAALEADDIDAALKYVLNTTDERSRDLAFEPVAAERIATFLLNLKARNEKVVPKAYINRLRGTLGQKVRGAPVTSAICSGGIDQTPITLNFPKVSGHRYLVVLCSDGVTKFLGDHEILDACLNALNPNFAVIEINKRVQDRQGLPEYPAPDHATTVAFLA